MLKILNRKSIKGFNRIEWKLDKNPSPYAGQINKGNQNYEQEEHSRFLRGSGIIALPGEYRVKMIYNQAISEAAVNVIYDPRSPAPDIRVMKGNYHRADEIGSRIKDLNSRYQKFFDCNGVIAKVDELSGKYMVFGDSVRSFQDSLRKKYENIDRKLTSRPDGLFSKINETRVLTTATGRLSENEEKSVSEALTALDEASKLINDFLDNDWVIYRQNLSGKSVPVNAVLK